MYTHTSPYIKWGFIHFKESVFTGTVLVILRA